VCIYTLCKYLLSKSNTHKRIESPYLEFSAPLLSQTLFPYIFTYPLMFVKPKVLFRWCLLKCGSVHLWGMYECLQWFCPEIVKQYLYLILSVALLVFWMNSFIWCCIDATRCCWVEGENVSWWMSTSSPEVWAYKKNPEIIGK
jgi:hypothetical protein